MIMEEYTLEHDWEDLIGDYKSPATLDILKYASKDVVEIILLKLDHLNLKEACKISRRVYEICKSKSFKKRYFEKWGKISLDVLVDNAIKKNSTWLGKFKHATAEDIDQDDNLNKYYELIDEDGNINSKVSVYTDGNDNWLIFNIAGVVNIIFKSDKNGYRYGMTLTPGYSVSPIYITPDGKSGDVIDVPKKYKDLLRYNEVLKKGDPKYKEAVEYFMKMFTKLIKK